MNKTTQGLLALLLSVAVIGVADARAQRCKAHKPETTPGKDFVIHGNGTVTHKKTGLMWKRCTEGFSGQGCSTGTFTKFYWEDMMGKGRFKRFAGYSDWRVPTIDEMKSIVEKRCKGPSANLEVFPNTPNLQSWSSSEAGNGKAWQMYVSSGVAIKANKAVESTLRLVRQP